MMHGGGRPFLSNTYATRFCLENATMHRRTRLSASTRCARLPRPLQVGGHVSSSLVKFIYVSQVTFLKILGLKMGQLLEVRM